MVKVGFFQMPLWCLSELQTLVQNMLNFTQFFALVHNMFRKSWVRLLFDQSESEWENSKLAIRKKVCGQ